MIHHLVAQMLNVFKETVLDPASALKITSEILTKDVAQNASSIPIVNPIKHAFEINVEIHAQEFVDKMLNAKLLIIFQHALVFTTLSVIHSLHVEKIHLLKMSP